jgi:hypothetical protein
MTTRFTLSELSSAVARGKFTTLDTVTITLYRNTTGTAETLDTANCTEIGTTGHFYWEFSNITTAPTDYSDYLWIMSNGTPAQDQHGNYIFGGWPEYIEATLPDADICKITAKIFEADGDGKIEPNDLFDPLKKNYIEIKSSYYANSRYFKLDKYKPSLDQINDGLIYWLMPQGATVDIRSETIGVNETGLTVPLQSTIDLNTWITT